MSQATRGIVRELHDESHLEDRELQYSSSKRRSKTGISNRERSRIATTSTLPMSTALTYYHDRPEEMRSVERERDAAVEDHKHLTTDPDDVRN